MHCSISNINLHFLEFCFFISLHNKYSPSIYINIFIYCISFKYIILNFYQNNSSKRGFKNVNRKKNIKRYGILFLSGNFKNLPT